MRDGSGTQASVMVVLTISAFSSPSHIRPTKERSILSVLTGSLSTPLVESETNSEMTVSHLRAKDFLRRYTVNTTPFGMLQQPHPRD